MTKDKADGGLVALAYARSLVDYLRAGGLDPLRLYEAKRVAEIESGDTRTRMPVLEWVSMFDAAIRATADPDLPLKVGEAIKTRHYGMLGFVEMHCATLGECIAQLERYEVLVGDISTSQLLRRNGRAEIHWRSPFGSDPPPALAQSSLAGWASYARWLTDKSDLVGEAYFQFARPRDLSAYARIFRAPTHFGAAETRIVFPEKYLALPIVQSDPQMRALALAQADALLKELQDEPEFLRRLKASIAQGLLTGRVSLGSSADALQLSVRTLQRRLDEHGQSFQQVLDATRRTQAERHLRDPRLTLAEVAFMLGYSEQSAFTRAFKQWTGNSPGAYRNGRWKRSGSR
jgi:AraC-like DNA-binding protein